MRKVSSSRWSWGSYWAAPSSPSRSPPSSSASESAGSGTGDRDGVVRAALDRKAVGERNQALEAGSSSAARLETIVLTSGVPEGSRAKGAAKGGGHMRKAVVTLLAVAFGLAPAAFAGDFGPGNSNKGPNDPGAKCHPPGQTNDAPGCK
jgi:hypothetical protein